MNDTNQALPLDVLNMQLRGRHIIEASAGTGKTFNITRIFIRLLLEKQVDVQKILIVTFTKAATEELKGRIAQEVTGLLDTLIAHRQDKSVSIDTTFATMITRLGAGADSKETDNEEADTKQTDGTISELSQQAFESDEQRHHWQLDKAITLLKTASLDLDEASIFTINSFCQRVLKQSAFLRKQSFTPELVHSSRAYLIQEVQDWFRRNQSNESLVTNLAFLDVLTPDKFLSAFGDALYGYKELHIEASSLNELEAEYTVLKDQLATANHTLEADHQALFKAVKDILNNQASVFESVLNDEKHQKKRPAYARLLDWAQCDDVSVLNPPSAFTPLLGVTLIKAFMKGSATFDADVANLTTFKDVVVGYLKTRKSLEAQLKLASDKVKQARTFDAYKEIHTAIVEIKAKVAIKKQDLSIIDHDDTIHLLAQAIAQEAEVTQDKPYPSTKQDLIDYVAKHYPYALIDEFQDTDSAQYSIFANCYPKSHASRMLLMIGDPKQAIYGFRGGDINTYLAARTQADEEWSMQHNFRSSEDVIDAYNAMFYGANLNEHDLAFVKSHLPTSQQNQDSELSKIEDGTELHDAFVFDDDIPYPWIYKGISGKKEDHFADTQHGAIHFQVNEDVWSEAKHHHAKEFKDQQAQAVASEIVRLTQEAKINNKAVELKDIAILVEVKSEARRIKSYLQQANIPSVYLSEKTDIFDSPEALSLFYVLDGILNANHNTRFFRALSTDLLGFSPEALLAMHDDIRAFDACKERIFEYKQIWHRDGVLVLVITLLKERFQARSNAVPKERILTNYSHLAELLNTQSKATEHAYQLLNWLKKQLPMTNAESTEQDEQENVQRLESDEALVKIITLHGSKGLEYPIVFIPFAGYKVTKPSSAHLVRYHHAEKQMPVVQFGKTDDAQAALKAQTFAEQTRLLYVGITRAVHRCYLGVARDGHYKTTPLCYLLDKQSVDGLGTSEKSASEKGANPNQPSRIKTLEQLAQGNTKLFNYRRYYMDSPIITMQTNAIEPTLLASEFNGPSDNVWQLESFSKIVKQQTRIDLTRKERDEAAYSLKTEQSEQNANAVLDATNAIEQPKINQYRFTIEKSADTGTLLHNILEDCDFQQTLNLDNSNRHVAFYNNAHRQADCDGLAEWLNDVLRCPLPSLNDAFSSVEALSNHTDDKSIPNVNLTATAPQRPDFQDTFTLASLATASVLKEPEFYFPLDQVSARDLSLLLKVHRSESNTLSSIPQAAHTAPYFNVGKLQGMMHGFIDLLFERNGKYYVADYKSNYLGDNPANYSHQNMRAAIESHHYDLQYIVYSWALDRYLSERLANYDREQHFGGVYYLFLRGMSPSNPIGTGVYQATLSEQLWQTLEDVFGQADTPQTPAGAES